VVVEVQPSRNQANSITAPAVSEVTFRGLEIRDLEILGMGSWTEEAGFRAIELWVEGLASGIGVRPKHRRSGDPGLWVRNKEQWADRRAMTANTRVRGPRRVSRSSSIRRPLSSNKW